MLIWYLGVIEVFGGWFRVLGFCRVKWAKEEFRYERDVVENIFFF